MTIDYSIKVTQCEPSPGYKLKVTCSDGATGIFDMSRYIGRGMFKPLKDPQTFDRVRLAFGVPSWPGDIDIAAERIRSTCKSSEARIARPSPQTAGAFHAHAHEGRDMTPAPRFFAGPFRFPRPEVSKPTAVSMTDDWHSETPAFPQGHGRKRERE